MRRVLPFMALLLAGCAGEPNAPASNCLTREEAAIIDSIWAGPHNTHGKTIYPGMPRGGDLLTLNLPEPLPATTAQIQWNHEDATYQWRTLTEQTYPAEAELGSNTNGDLINSHDVTLEPVRDRGAKILMWHGSVDNLITPVNSLKYYVQVAAHFSNISDAFGNIPDFAALQPWFRYFWTPGVSHCGGGPGPQPQNLFNIMVNWVENGVAPDSILASGGGRARPLCPFPQEAIYDGVGDPNAASSFSCGGNIQTRQVICDGLLVKYKQETGAALEEFGGVYNEASCGIAPPDEATDKATGAGWLANSAGGKLNFGFKARRKADGTLHGNLQFSDHAAAIKIELSQVSSLGDAGEGCGAVPAGANALRFEGTGTFNGAAASFRVCVQDNGEGSASAADLFHLACTNGCSYSTSARAADEAMDGGNIQVRRSGTAAASGEATPATAQLGPLLLGASASGVVQPFTVTLFDQNQQPLGDVAVTLKRWSGSGEVASWSGRTALVTGTATIYAPGASTPADYQASAVGGVQSNYVHTVPLGQ